MIKPPYLAFSLEEPHEMKPDDGITIKDVTRSVFWPEKKYLILEEKPVEKEKAFNLYNTTLYFGCRKCGDIFETKDAKVSLITSAGSVVVCTIVCPKCKQ